MGGFQRVVSVVLTAAVAVCLIAAWILTTPLLSGGAFLTDSYRKRFGPNIR